MFLLVFFVFLSVIKAQCPDGSKQANDVCLFPKETESYFDQAMSTCRSMDGRLVEIKDAFTNALVNNIAYSDLRNRAIFIGVRQQKSGVWTFADGSALTYSKWDKDQPDYSHECAVLNPESASWRSADCFDYQPFVCEVAMETTTASRSTTTATRTTTSTTTTTTTTFHSTTTPTTTPKHGTCDASWHYNDLTRFCYYVQDFYKPDGFSWRTYKYNEAETRCVQSGGHLVSIHSKEEDDFVMGLLETENLANEVNATIDDGGPCKAGEAFIGLKYKFGETAHKWTDGTTVDYFAAQGFDPDSNIYFSMINDPSCASQWDYTYFQPDFARYVCKKPAHLTP